MQFQKNKKTFFAISKMAKNQFLHIKKPLTTKNAIFGLFSGAKIDFFYHFWNCKKCVFVLLKLHFFPILEHCELWLVNFKKCFINYVPNLLISVVVVSSK